MTTMTMNAGFQSAAAFSKPSFAEIRAALPDMPAEGTLYARVAGAAGRVTLAAVPFAAVGWMFLAH
jgi:hypothetical protein